MSSWWSPQPHPEGQLGDAEAAAAATADSDASKEETVFLTGGSRTLSGDEASSNIAPPVTSINRRASTGSYNNKKRALPDDPKEQVAYYKEMIAVEKAGKRKLFHSLVKLANELRRMREESTQLVEQQSFYNRNWYEGGLWRAPAVLPGVSLMEEHRYSSHRNNNNTGSGDDNDDSSPPWQLQGLRLMAAPISLSDLFFNLVVVTAFTRVGMAISRKGSMELSHFLYFAVFWTVWSKEASYSTRFDTTDLSASITTLVTCFATLFACLSAHAPMETTDGTRIMIMAASVALLHCLLHLRVALTTCSPATPTAMSPSSQQQHQQQLAPEDDDDPLTQHIRAYAILNIFLNAAELVVWMLGIWFFPTEWQHRWAIFGLGILLALRIPRAFLSNDFHAACSKRGVLFILLLGFLLQSIVVVASEFFEYQTPSLEDYAFLGAACLMFFCIKLLYVDDTTNRAEDHALLVNRWAGFFFNVGNFTLLLSTTVMGSGLNLLTHSYFAATAALPGPAKNLVCGGFSASLLSTLFIKSMHLKRVPVDARHKALFISAYIVQSLVLLAVVGITAIMCLSNELTGLLGYLMQSDIQLLFCLSGAALVVVVMSWLDEGVELALYSSADDSKEYRISPFGFWWCLHPEVSDEEVLVAEVAAAQQRQSSILGSSSGGDFSRTSATARSLSALSPLLGSSIADIKLAVRGYGTEEV